MPEPTFDHNKKPLERSTQPEAGEKGKDSPSHPLADLQRQVGNRAVQQLIQRSGGQGAYELDEDTTGRINSARGGGQELESSTQEQMSKSIGYDFSDVNVHTSREADELNQAVGAEAFTTGNDVFFREGAYNPGSQEGQELIAHELTHVVQQGTGQTGSSAGMTVNAPGDAHEKEADVVAQSVAGPGGQDAVQKQEIPEEEEVAQMQEDEELIQMQEDEELAQMQEDEELAQMQPIEEEEEMIQPKRSDGLNSARLGG
jgi:hypothetical protein